MSSQKYVDYFNIWPKPKFLTLFRLINYSIPYNRNDVLMYKTTKITFMHTHILIYMYNRTSTCEKSTCSTITQLPVTTCSKIGQPLKHQSTNLVSEKHSTHTTHTNTPTNTLNTNIVNVCTWYILAACSQRSWEI